MIGFFIKKHIPKKDHSPSLQDRKHIAQGCSYLGIILNIFLFLSKFLAGTLSGSIAITSDAFNNLSDAGSSVITLFGIRLSMKKPDPEHPFGHGRIEYLSGLAVSLLIILMGFELAKESFSKILSPTPAEDGFFPITVFILLLSIFTKVYMWYYNRKYGKLIRSAAMSATAVDSLSDSAATLAVLISSVIARACHIYRLDGICGFVVSLFIFYAGFRAAKETLVPLLGQPADPALVHEIESIIQSHEKILGIHDLVIHDYGPGRLMASVHAEVPYDGSILEIHDLIDNIEVEIKEKTMCEIVIHMDPVNHEDPQTMALKAEVSEIIRTAFPGVTLHDFRVVHGSTHTNLIFDVIKPFSLNISNEELCKSIREMVLKKRANHFCVIKVDNDYT